MHCRVYEKWKFSESVRKCCSGRGILLRIEEDGRKEHQKEVLLDPVF